MSKIWLKKGPYALLIYTVFCAIIRKVIRATSPIYFIFFLSIPILPLTLMLLKGMKKGLRKDLNVLFISLIDTCAVIMCMYIIVDQRFPVYLKAHEKFFDFSFIFAIGLFLLSAILSVIIVSKYGKLGH